jgi:hypothetical protein
MTDAKKVEALRDLISDVLHAYDMTIYDMEDPHARSLVNKWSDIFFDRMLKIVHSEDDA